MAVANVLGISSSKEAGGGWTRSRRSASRKRRRRGGTGPRRRLGRPATGRCHQRLALTLAALLAAGVPLFAIGISIGYSLSTKAALAVAQSLLLPLAFGGGLFLPPETFPGWLDAISGWLPIRAGRDPADRPTTSADLPGAALVMLTGWTVLAGSLAVWAYRRDEGRRFRRNEPRHCSMAVPARKLGVSPRTQGQHARLCSSGHQVGSAARCEKGLHPLIAGGISETCGP